MEAAAAAEPVRSSPSTAAAAPRPPQQRRRRRRGGGARFSGEEEEEEEEEEEVRLRTLSSVDYETDEIEFSAYGEHDTAENIAGIWQMVPSPSTGRRSSPQETGTFSLLMREAAEELSRFIAAGKLHCKIDKVSDILETNRPDARNAFYRATIKQGDFFHLIWC
uniref:Uncharacterized protein n=1 Tax=Ananas comosus var. bracteatus TaxID=296719 RepID=A0A6V7NSF7_ANACO|nr:unnamed protein product [Ananas comosus var. bracteatus]